LVVIQLVEVGEVIGITEGLFVVVFVDCCFQKRKMQTFTSSKLLRNYARLLYLW